LRRIGQEEEPRLRKPYPFVSVLIPARNEEKNIRRCVMSLLESDYPRMEIMVLDDNSQDRTYEILERLSVGKVKLKVIRGKKLPPGWTGKNWSCHQLAQVARGDWFLFTDADTIHQPRSIAVALTSAKKAKAVFLTLIPGLTAKTWSEKLFMPIIHFAFLVLVPFKLINYSQEARISLGIGPFLLVERDFYFSCGGHESVKDRIVDDIALARRVKGEKGKISIIDGTRIMNVRFYTSFKDVWKGFSKNCYEAIGGAPHYLAVILLICYFLFIYPYLALWAAFSSHQAVTLPLLQVMTISAIRTILSLRFQTSIIFGLLHPFSIILALSILVNSFRLSLFKKKIEWKERYYLAK
jgi:chlorobactene glucosyltransferase